MSSAIRRKVIPSDVPVQEGRVEVGVSLPEFGQVVGEVLVHQVRSQDDRQFVMGEMGVGFVEKRDFRLVIFDLHAAPLWSGGIYYTIMMWNVIP